MSELNKKNVSCQISKNKINKKKGKEKLAVCMKFWLAASQQPRGKQIF